jgi:hypothetical protein
VERLREKIRRLGEVNPMAEQEFNDLQRRFEHLCTEKRDLERSLENFWRPGRQIDEMPAETEPFAAHALLRRLGQSPLQGKFPLVGLLASIYDSMAARGRELRERES